METPGDVIRSFIYGTAKMHGERCFEMRAVYEMGGVAPQTVFVACLLGAATVLTPDYAWAYVLAALVAATGTRYRTHTREGMAPADDGPDGEDRSVESAIRLPRTNMLIVFAHTNNAGKITNSPRFAAGGAFAVKADRELFSTVVGPRSDTVLRKSDVAIFVTIGDNAQRAGDVSLFLAKCNAVLEDGGAEQRVEMALRDRKSGSGRVLVGTYGSDTLDVVFEDTVTARTYYMIRANGKLTVGVSEPFTSTAHENETDTTAVVVNQSTQPCQINGTGAKIGTVLNVAVYEGDVSAVNGDILRSLARHALESNELYGELRGQLDKQREITDAMKRPRFGGEDVARACANVEWPSFDPPTAGAECRRAIDASCKTDAAQRGCECWDAQSEVFATRECMLLRELYAPKKARVVEPAPGGERNVQIERGMRPVTVAGNGVKPPGWLAWLFSH
jgi:hypothetical protein